LGYGPAHRRDKARTSTKGVAVMIKERCRMGLEFDYSEHSWWIVSSMMHHLFIIYEMCIHHPQGVVIIRSLLIVNDQIRQA
jgi:hypothetical protein